MLTSESGQDEKAPGSGTKWAPSATVVQLSSLMSHQHNAHYEYVNTCMLDFSARLRKKLLCNTIAPRCWLRFFSFFNPWMKTFGRITRLLAVETNCILTLVLSNKLQLQFIFTIHNILVSSQLLEIKKISEKNTVEKRSFKRLSCLCVYGMFVYLDGDQMGTKSFLSL